MHSTPATSRYTGLILLFFAAMSALEAWVYTQKGSNKMSLDEQEIIAWKHPEMIVHGKRPLNMESPVHLLDDAVTPVEKMFVRNNGLLPASLNADTWTLTIDGEGVPKPKTYTLKELKARFAHHTYHLVLECGGNGRGEMNPPASGIQWGYGAVSCARWTGVRLRDVLQDAGVTKDAVYVGYYGTDRHLSGDASKVVISRGVPIATAMQDESLLAFALNGEDIPAVEGYPLRMVVGGWPASVSGKWVHRLAVRNQVHDGPKMEAPSYRVPATPIEPGGKATLEDMKIVEAMPVRSIITYPKTGAVVKPGQRFEVRGHAWAGDLSVKEVQVSTNYGRTWQTARLDKPVNKNAWQRFRADVQLQSPGYYEIWVKATDSNGESQPMVVPEWNPNGYLNNATHRIAVKVQ
jgi:DMSO/TMAO reductase YedYZ molybdopterin-dependent catalytic subunit